MDVIAGGRPAIPDSKRYANNTEGGGPNDYEIADRLIPQRRNRNDSLGLGHDTIRGAMTTLV